MSRTLSAAQKAIAAFGPNYRAARLEERGKGLLLLTRSIAFLYVVFGSMGALLTAGIQLFSDQVPVNLPVYQFWPTLPGDAKIMSGPTAHVLSGGFTNAAVNVSGLDVPVRLWLAANSLLQNATIIVIAFVVYRMCNSLLRNDPFRPAITRGIRIMGWSVLAGGLSWQVCAAIAGALASRQVLGVTSAGWTTPTMPIEDLNAITGFPQPGWQFTIDFWPIGLGLALLAVAGAFRYGERLQRDRERLQRDTEGLV